MSESFSKIRLGVNIDHIATLRQLRAGLVDYPDILQAAKIVAESGADQITIHLRGDRRHIQESDLFLLSRVKTVPINLEMAATEEMEDFAVKASPLIVCLVPEKREELTTEGGLDVIRASKRISSCVKRMHENKIRVSLFIEPERDQIKQSRDLGADAVEFHTGQYALAKNNHADECLRKLRESFEFAHDVGLAVHCGHGLDYKNTQAVVKLPFLEEVNIGHSIICRAVIVGLAQAVREMKSIINEAKGI